MHLEAAALRNAEALVALLEQALNLAQRERDQLQQEQPDVHFDLPDAAVALAASSFLAGPAVRGAAGFLAFSAVPV
jgi:hypothetical protein